MLKKNKHLKLKKKVNDNKGGKGARKETLLPYWWRVIFGNIKRKPLKTCQKFKNYMDTIWSNNFVFKNLS